MCVERSQASLDPYSTLTKHSQPRDSLHFLPCFQCAGFDSMHLPQLDSFTYGFCILLSQGLSSRTPLKAALQAANGRPSAGPFSSMYTENVAMSH